MKKVAHHDLPKNMCWRIIMRPTSYRSISTTILSLPKLQKVLRFLQNSFPYFGNRPENVRYKNLGYTSSNRVNSVLLNPNDYFYLEKFHPSKDWPLYYGDLASKMPRWNPCSSKTLSMLSDLISAFTRQKNYWALSLSNGLKIVVQYLIVGFPLNYFQKHRLGRLEKVSKAAPNSFWFSTFGKQYQTLRTGAMLFKAWRVWSSFQWRTFCACQNSENPLCDCSPKWYGMILEVGIPQGIAVSPEKAQIARDKHRRNSMWPRPLLPCWYYHRYHLSLGYKNWMRWFRRK